MTPTEISAVAGILLSLFFAYVPGVKTWFDGLDGVYKRLVVAVSLVLAAGGALVWGCYQLGGNWQGCIAANWQSYVTGLIAALVSSQGTYLLAVRKPALTA